MVKNLPACNAGASGDLDLIPRLGRSLEEGMATHSSLLVLAGLYHCASRGAK